jgi:hypothetical protein
LIKLSVAIKQRMMRHGFLHLAYFMMLKQKTHPNMNYHLFSDWGRSWALLKSFFVESFFFGWKPQNWTHFAQFFFLCLNISWSCIKEGGRDPSGSKLHALLHFGLWVYCWHVHLNAQLLQNWWDWKSESSQPKTYKFLFYFNNNLGIEKLGMSIIIIILGCGYRSLTELIRLIGGQLIIKQLPIN